MILLLLSDFVAQTGTEVAPAAGTHSSCRHRHGGRRHPPRF